MSLSRGKIASNLIEFFFQMSFKFQGTRVNLMIRRRRRRRRRIASNLTLELTLFDFSSQTSFYNFHFLLILKEMRRKKIKLVDPMNFF